MTMTEHPQRERTQQPQDDPRAQANRDLAREHGNQVDILAELAAEGFGEADRETDAKTQYEDGLQVLRFLIGADRSERSLEIDHVLHDEHGSFLKDKAVEYIDLLLAGVPSMQARQVLVRRQPARQERARARREAIARARAVSSNLHYMAEGPRTQPALPPRREAIAPPPVPSAPLESERVPHVDEDPKWSTTQLGQIALAGEARGVLKPETVQRLSDEGYSAPRKAAAPDMGPAAPVEFGAAMVPQQRLGDTQRLPMDEVLGHLALDDAGAEAPNHQTKDGRSKPGKKAVPPFGEAAVSGSGASDDDAS